MKLFSHTPAAKTNNVETYPVDVKSTLEKISDEKRVKARIYYPFVLAASFAAVCAGRESQLATPAELVALRDAQALFTSFQEQVDSVGHDSAKRQVDAARSNYLTDPDEGSFEVLRDAELNQATLEAHHAKMRETVKTAMRAHCRSTNSLVLPVLARALAMVEAETASLQSNEATTAARYGVPFAPSPTLAGLEALGISIENQMYEIAQEVGVRSSLAGRLAGILKL